MIKGSSDLVVIGSCRFLGLLNLNFPLLVCILILAIGEPLRLHVPFSSCRVDHLASVSPQQRTHFGIPVLVASNKH